MKGLAEVLAEVITGRCSTCLRPRATDEHWATTAGGERPDLCWESHPEACPWEPTVSLADLQEAAVLDWLRERLAGARGPARLAADVHPSPWSKRHADAALAAVAEALGVGEVRG